MSQEIKGSTVTQKSKNITLLIELLMIMVGNTILALGLNWFLAPSDLVVGGVTGITIIFEALASIPMWITNILINVPLFAIAAKQKGFKFVAKSAFSAGFLSIALIITPYIPPIVADQGILMNTIYGALFLGIGIGIVLRASATTGGTDMAATIIHNINRNIPISKVILIMDSIIVIFGAFVFGVDKAMYALIAIYINANVVSWIIDGGNASKSVLIISDKHDELGKAIIARIRRGATALKGTGMYTQQEKNILYVVVGKNQIVELQKIVKEIDPRAFITIMDAKEVIGEGFREH